MSCEPKAGDPPSRSGEPQSLPPRRAPNCPGPAAQNWPATHAERPGFAAKTGLIARNPWSLQRRLPPLTERVVESQEHGARWSRRSRQLVLTNWATFLACFTIKGVHVAYAPDACFKEDWLWVYGANPKMSRKESRLKRAACNLCGHVSSFEPPAPSTRELVP